VHMSNTGTPGRSLEHALPVRVRSTAVRAGSGGRRVPGGDGWCGSSSCSRRRGQPADERRLAGARAQGGEAGLAGRNWSSTGRAVELLPGRCGPGCGRRPAADRDARRRGVRPEGVTHMSRGALAPTHEVLQKFLEAGSCPAACWSPSRGRRRRQDDAAEAVQDVAPERRPHRHRLRWNSSPFVRPSSRRARRSTRSARGVLPAPRGRLPPSPRARDPAALWRGTTVVADRYLFTALARDVSAGWSSTA